MADVTMPRLSDTMEEGKLLRWLKQAGEPIEAGEILAEVETDKADMEIEATTSGVLRELKLAEGESAAVGAVIAVIEGRGEGGGDRGAGAARERATANGAERAPAAAPARERPARAEAPAARKAERPEDRPAREEGTPNEPDERRAPAPATEERGAAAPPATDRRGPAPAPAARPAAASARAAAPSLQGSRARGDGGAKVSPLARSLAAELGIDPTGVRGTGPGGRVTRADVEAAHRARGGDGGGRAAPERSAPSADASDGAAGRDDAGAGAETAARGERPEAGGEKGEAPSAGGRPQGAAPGIVRVRPPAMERAAARPAASSGAAGDAGLRTRRVPLTRMRASIARRMAESKREAPHFYLTTTIAMDEAVRLRASLRELAGEGGGVTFNHMVVKACADALAAFPEMNARFAGDAIELIEEVNVGVATAVDEGLIVPVIHGADRLSLLEIAARARDLGERAKGGSFSGNDLSGATFSVSNLGMFGVESFAAVINPPQAGILAVGSVEPRPVVREGALAVGHTMSATLSCDHRAVDGARGARFLADVKRRLENPVSLILATGGPGSDPR
ncbi:MAG TPA: dihydrolipoamide acetyltransferase family protein [Candidatus Binatia bacterium]|nr:dihydrolipoamide acetyltransferase family protein [Candidatus Binatia bacterium]